MKRFVCIVLGFSVAAALGDTVVEGDWTVVYPNCPKENRGLKHGLGTMADVLCDVLGESVGVKARAVVEGREPKGPGRRFFMGGKFAEAAELMPADFKGYDWGIAEKDGDIYFFGRDRAGANPNNATGCVIPSALAASKFMSQCMGVMFLMPGKVGREVPRLKRLSVPKGFSLRGSVKAEFQTGRNFEYSYSMANGLYGCGVTKTFGGHTYPSVCPRETYFKTHPEYFAKDDKGKPIWGGSHGCQAYCISNSNFQRLIYEAMLKSYDIGAETCQLGQNDGPAGVCRCDNCRKMYGGCEGLLSNDCRTVYGASGEWSEKLWLFHKEIAERLMKDRPGKLVQIMCYGDTADPPKSFKAFPPNVMIEVCSYEEADMRKWNGYTVPNGFTYYIYNWGWYPLLGFTPKRSVAGLVDQVQRFHRYGLKGIYRCGYGEMFGMEGPAYWVFNKLVEDPDVDVRGALEQYYAGAFGPAAMPMKKFYEDLEEPLAEVEKLNSTKASDLVGSTIKHPKDRGPIDALATVYTPERVERMEAALKEAERTQGLSEKQVRRLELVRTEWNYARNVGSIMYMYRDFREHPTKDGCFKILMALRERNEMIRDLFQNGKMRKVKGWPEIQLFGEPPIGQFRLNGRLAAEIKIPLTWDVEKMLKYRIVPNEIITPEERKTELKKAGLKPLAGFLMGNKEEERKRWGITFEPYPDGTGFRFGQGSNGYVRVSARVGEKHGLQPGKTYRISWITKWDGVNVNRPWHGYYFRAGYDVPTKEDKHVVKVPNDPYPLHSGSSNGWRRESVVMKVCDKPGFVSEFTFAFWGGKDGVADVRDVVIEEVGE